MSWITRIHSRPLGTGSILLLGLIGYRVVGYIHADQFIIVVVVVQLSSCQRDDGREVEKNEFRLSWGERVSQCHMIKQDHGAVIGCSLVHFDLVAACPCKFMFVILIPTRDSNKKNPLEHKARRFKCESIDDERFKSKHCLSSRPENTSCPELARERKTE